ATRPDQPDKLAVIDTERHVIERVHRATFGLISLRHAIDMERGAVRAKSIGRVAHSIHRFAVVGGIRNGRVHPRQAPTRCSYQRNTSLTRIDTKLANTIPASKLVMSKFIPQLAIRCPSPAREAYISANSTPVMLK